MEDIKNKDEAYMRRALMEAQAAFDEDEIPVGMPSSFVRTGSYREPTILRRC